MQASPSDPELGATGSYDARRSSLRTSFRTQANALVRKNLTFQKRNVCTNVCLVIFPILICLLIAGLQKVIDIQFGGDKYSCGCRTVNGTKVCGIQYSTAQQAPRCGIETPQPWPAFVQVPAKQYRGYHEGLSSGCFSSPDGCPNVAFYTGSDKTLADRMSANLFKPLPSPSPSASPFALAQYILGTSAYPYTTYFLESAFTEAPSISILQPLNSTQASSSSWRSSAGWPRVAGSVNLSFSSRFSAALPWEYTPVASLYQKDAKSIWNILYNGYYKANQAKPIPENQKINEVALAYDFRSTRVTSPKLTFDTVVYYNKTVSNFSGGGGPPPSYVRINQPMNLAVNAFLSVVLPGKEARLRYLTEMPKVATKLNLDLSSLIGPLFYMWVIQLLLPVFLYYLLYDKEKNLRTMMKMHGLGDQAYYLVQYLYFLAISILYMFLFVAFASAINIKLFRLTDGLLQALFFFIYINNQIAFAFFGASFISKSRLGTVIAYIYVFGSGLLGNFLLQYFIEDKTFPKVAIVFLQWLPGFSLYRGLYEFSSYAFIGNYNGTKGMTFKNLSDSENGIGGAMAILVVEWAVFLLVAFYLDQVLESGSGIAKSPLFFLESCMKKKDSEVIKPVKQTVGKDTEMEGPDVANERAVVHQILAGGGQSGYSILCDNLTKVYPGRDGNPPKFAVQGMSLAVPRGECFGMLGPNGAGKTSSISMMIGFLTPTEGTAIIEGMDIRRDIDKIYCIMGVCPQHDLLWEVLTAREHLLFYGRLKNLRGAELEQAVNDSLKSVNLYSVKDKRSGKYSGGMKRRLSVAISLIGNPLVVYMDEPSTGLDPASRSNLWTVVKNAKRNRAIILTTHSMEEAEVLCDRLGIFVDGKFACIGNPKELTARYGGTYIFTITTPPEQEPAAAALAQSFSRRANLLYSLAGTQKFEIPVGDVQIADVFASVEEAKKRLSIQAWGITNTTLEDVFIKIAKGSNAGKNIALV